MTNHLIIEFDEKYKEYFALTYDPAIFELAASFINKNNTEFIDTAYFLNSFNYCRSEGGQKNAGYPRQVWIPLAKFIDFYKFTNQKDRYEVVIYNYLIQAHNILNTYNFYFDYLKLNPNYFDIWADVFRPSNEKKYDKTSHYMLINMNHFRVASSTIRPYDLKNDF